MKIELQLLKKLNRSYKDLNLSYYRLWIAFALMLIIALLEMAGLSLLYPLVLCLGGNKTTNNSETFLTSLMDSNSFNFSTLINIEAHNLFIIFAIIFVIKNVSLFGAYSYNVGFSTYYYKNFVKGIYRVYLNRSILSIQSDGGGYLTNIICVETKKLIDGIVRPIFVLLTELAITIGISIIAFLISPIAICMVVVGCVVSVSIYYKALRKQALSWGANELNETAILHDLVQNTAKGISEIRIFGRYKTLSNKVEEIMEQKTKMFHNLEMYQQVPRYIIETTFIVIIMTFCAVSVIMGKELSVLLAQFSIIIAAAFRTLPGVNRIVGSYSNISFHLLPALSLMNIVSELEDIEVKKQAADEDYQDKIIPNLQRLSINKVSFKYPGSNSEVLSNINLNINKNSRIGIVGDSGSGKSTLIKIIAGLYPYTSGSITINGVDIQHNEQRWQSMISYVPQEAFIIPGTLLENIAFGDNSVSLDRIYNVIEQVRLNKFIETLPKGVNTILGGRGINLSGGQRQLVCLARALYNNPKLLLLDEPTAALDVNNERVVLDVIDNLKENVATIMISHKINNFDNFDEVYLCEHGTVKKVNLKYLDKFNLKVTI